MSEENKQKVGTKFNVLQAITAGGVTIALVALVLGIIGMSKSAVKIPSYSSNYEVNVDSTYDEFIDNLKGAGEGICTKISGTEDINYSAHTVYHKNKSTYECGINTFGYYHFESTEKIDIDQTWSFVRKDGVEEFTIKDLRHEEYVSRELDTSEDKNKIVEEVYITDEIVQTTLSVEEDGYYISIYEYVPANGETPETTISRKFKYESKEAYDDEINDVIEEIYYIYLDEIKLTDYNYYLDEYNDPIVTKEGNVYTSTRDYKAMCHIPEGNVYKVYEEVYSAKTAENKLLGGHYVTCVVKNSSFLRNEVTIDYTYGEAVIPALDPEAELVPTMSPFLSRHYIYGLSLAQYN